MKIVVVGECLSEQMGYSIGFYPKALAELGHEVHLVTSDGQAYFTSADYSQIFEKFIGPAVVPCGVKSWRGCTLHRLPHHLGPRRCVTIKGLARKLAEIKPDIVHSVGLWSGVGYQVAAARPFLGFKVFMECHVHASVFPPFIVKIKTFPRWVYWRVYRPMTGRILSVGTEICWAIGEDVREIARDYFGFPDHKIKLMTLGTDTQMFSPWYEQPANERQEFRKQLGFDDSHIVCIYTGRMQEGKDPMILAKAIDRMVKEGKPYRAIFIGGGSEKYEMELKSYAGCTLIPFIPVDDLPRFYQAADIAVWPKQESTSQMDAASCGLPLVLSNRIKVTERVNGNGLMYEENNMDDLIIKLLELKDPAMRRQLGQVGVAKVRANYSWHKIASECVKEYERALAK